MTPHRSTLHSPVTRLSAWLLAMALLLAPGLTDVCSTWCSMPAHASSVAAARTTHGAQAMGHDHCAKPAPTGATVSTPRAWHTGALPALEPATHQCLLHARTGAPVADDNRLATTRASASRSGLAALASPPTSSPVVFSLARLARSGAVSDRSLQIARPTPLPLQRPLRI